MNICTSSYDDKLRIESAVIVSYDDKSKIETTEELEEINTTERQKVKEYEILEMTDKEAELVNEKENDKTISNNENIVAENLGTNEMAAPLGSVRLLRRAQKAVVQSNVPSDNELAATDENGTNEMAAPEMISKAVVQSDVPDEKNKDNETEIEDIGDEKEIRKEYQNGIIGVKYL